MTTETTSAITYASDLLGAEREPDAVADAIGEACREFPHADPAALRRMFTREETR